MAFPFRDDLPTRRVPWLTMALVAVNVVVFLFVQPPVFQRPASDSISSAMADTAEGEEFLMRWGVVSCEVMTGEPMADRPEDCDDAQTRYLPEEKAIPLSLLTAMFLHADVLHLAGNMLFLWVFGSNVEDRMGRAWFLVLYLLGGLIATMTFVLLQQSSSSPLLGASGAIAAAMGAYLVFYPRARILTVVTAGPQVVYLPAIAVLGLYFVTQFFTATEGVAWQAHAGGMAGGAALAVVLGLLPWIRARRRTDVDLGLRRRPEPSRF